MGFARGGKKSQNARVSLCGEIRPARETKPSAA
jgi:hypothetical protein